MGIQGVNKYRVTFFSPNGIEQSTVMRGNSLSNVIERVAHIMADPHGYFINDSRNNCYFRVINENVTYIQYELLFSGKEVTMERIKDLSPTILKTLFSKLDDSELYAISMYDMDEETKEFILTEMEDKLRIEVLEHIGEISQLSQTDIYRAQEIIIDKLISIMNSIERSNNNNII